jgi:hypothetical protein
MKGLPEVGDGGVLSIRDLGCVQNRGDMVCDEVLMTWEDRWDVVLKTWRSLDSPCIQSAVGLKGID